MQKFEPGYIPYKKRIFGGISFTTVAALVLGFLIFGSNTKYYLLFSFGIILLLLIYTLYTLTRHSKKYLKSLLIGDTHIEFTIVDKDKELPPITIPLGDVRIKIFELFINIHRVGRDFKLQIDLRKNGKFITVFEQYQIGAWNKRKFDDIYTSYCEAKNIPHKKIAAYDI